MDEDRFEFTEESLRAQDGMKVPLTIVPGGPVIGEATLKYNSETEALEAHYKVTDPDVAEFLKDLPPSVIFRKE